MAKLRVDSSEGKQLRVGALLDGVAAVEDANSAAFWTVDGQCAMTKQVRSKCKFSSVLGEVAELFAQSFLGELVERRATDEDAPAGGSDKRDDLAGQRLKGRP